MSKSITLLMISVSLFLGISMASADTEQEPKTIRIRGNSVTLGSSPGRLVYKSTGDLDGDGRTETVFSVELGDCAFYTVVTRANRSGWSIISLEKSGYTFSRADVADVNGDGRLEVIERTMSGDGHYICSIYNLAGNRLVEKLPENGDIFGLTKFRDIDHDKKLEVLSITPPSFMFLGDFWLTIYKWNGSGYVDVSKRFPAQYDRVIANIRQIIHDLQYTNDFGSRHKPNDDPELFGELYGLLGRAYEYRQQPEKARIQYAIAYRLYPDDDEIANAFRRYWVNAKKKN